MAATNQIQFFYPSKDHFKAKKKSFHKMGAEELIFGMYFSCRKIHTKN